MGMGLLGYAVTGAARGAADGGIYVLKQQMEEEKLNRIAEYNEGVRQRGRQSDVEADIVNAPRKAEAAVGAKELVAGRENALDVKRKLEVDFNPEVTAAETVKDTAKKKSALDFEVANEETTNRLLKNRTDATHRESAASVAQAALANFQLDRAKLAGVAQDALVRATKSGDQEMITEARKNLEALNSKGDDPKSAATMAAMSRTYTTLAAKLSDAGDTAGAAEAAKSAKTWGDMALKEMNADAKPADPKFKVIKPGDAPAPDPKKEAPKVEPPKLSESETNQQKLAQLEAKLAEDDAIRSGEDKRNSFGIRRLPMPIAERKYLERDIAELKQN